MLGITLKLDLGDLPEKLRKLQSVLDGPDSRSVMLAIGARFADITIHNFGVSGPHRASPWPSLTPRYMKRINYFGPPKLILSGRLISSINVGTVENHSVEVTSDTEYDSAHQFGLGRMKPRPFFPIEGSWSDARLTPYAEEQLEKTAQEGIDALSGYY